MRNLSNTTVVNDTYKALVDTAVEAVRTGTESYNEQIRSAIRKAGNAGLEVRVNPDGTSTGTKIVRYESGYTLRTPAFQAGAARTKSEDFPPGQVAPVYAPKPFGLGLPPPFRRGCVKGILGFRRGRSRPGGA